MSMDLNEFDEGDQLQPQKPFTPVYLVGHPKFVSTDKGDSIDFTVKHQTKNAFRTFKMFDIFKPKEDANEKLVAANKRQMVAMFGAIMKPEAFEAWKAIKPSDLKELYNTALQFIDPNVENLKLNLMFGYATQGKGYIQLPAFGSFISSEHRERSLVWDPNSLALEPVKRKKQRADDEEDDQNLNTADI